MGVVVHRAKRVRRCQRPTINDVDDQRSNDQRFQRSTMPTIYMGWSTIVIRADEPSSRLPPRVSEITFSPSNFEFKIGLVLKALKSSQNRPKSSENPPPDPPETAPERRLILQTPKIKNNANLPRFCSFLTFPGPRKSSQNRCQNAFKISFILDTLLEP